MTTKLSGAQRRKMRMAQGLPRYSGAEAAAEKARVSRRNKLRNQAQQEKIKLYLKDLKLARGCADCGYNTHAEALDFDHLPGHEKVAAVSALIKLTTMNGVMREVAKCDVVCANCHRVRTATRRDEGRRGVLVCLAG